MENRKSRKASIKKKGFRGRLIDWSNWLDREIELLIADWDEREDEESLLFQVIEIKSWNGGKLGKRH